MTFVAFCAPEEKSAGKKRSGQIELNLSPTEVIVTPRGGYVFALTTENIHRCYKSANVKKGCRNGGGGGVPDSTTL